MGTHWIDSATIDGFRNIRKLQLEGLGGLNIFVGENNSGKTSVLEALSILANYADPTEWDLMVGRRDYGRLDENRPQSIRWCFSRPRREKAADLPIEATCSMACSGEIGCGTLKIVCTDVVAPPGYGRSDSEDGAESELDVPELRRGVQLTHLVDIARYAQPELFGEQEPKIRPTEITHEIWEAGRPPVSKARSRKGRRVQTESLNPYSFQINRFLVRRFHEGKFAHSVSDVLSLLQVFDPEIVEIEVDSTRGVVPVLYLKHRRLGLAPLSVFGDGLRRAILLATTILSFENGGILFIDEIEAGIHVHAVQRVFSWLARVALERGVQVFVTTHSLEAVDAMVFGSGDAKTEVVAFHLDQGEERTTVKRFDGELLARLRRERGIDVR